MKRDSKISDIKGDNTFEKLSGYVPGILFQCEMDTEGNFKFVYLHGKVKKKWDSIATSVLENGNNVLKFIHPDDLHPFKIQMQKSAEKSCILQHSFRFKTTRGIYQWLQLNSFPDTQPDGSIVWYGIATDADKLMKEEGQYKMLSLIAENTENIVIVTNKDRKIEWVNKPFTELTGYTFEEVMGKSPGELLQGQNPDQPQVEEMRDLFNQGKPYKGEILNFRKTGDPYWLYMDIQPVFDTYGTLSRFIAIETDITEKKLKEERLKISEERFRMMAESSRDGLVIVNKDDIIEYISPAHEYLFGYNNEELIGTKSALIKEYIHPEDLEYWTSEVSSALKERKTRFTLRFRIKTKNGLYRWREDFVTLTYDKNGNKDMGYILCHDIHDKVLAENSLRNQRDRIRDILEFSPAAIIVIDDNEEIVLVNRAAEKLFNKKNNELVSQKCGNLIGCYYMNNESKCCGKITQCMNCDLYKDITSIIKGQDAISEKETQMLVNTNEGKKLLTINYSMQSLTLGGKKHVIISLTDITKQKENQNLENQLFIAQKTSGIKQNFLSNMSHEMRTPLNGIIGIVDILKKTNLTPEQISFIKVLEDSSDTLMNLINSVLDLSKIESGKIQIDRDVIDSHSLKTKFTSLYSNIALKKHMAFYFELSPDFPRFFISDENKLNQILTNLVGNALKFTRVGRVKITASILREKEEGFILQFDVEDTGMGIPSDKLDDIFNQFTQVDSTKTRFNEGTGLGLAITKNLVNVLGGEVFVKSTLNKGSKFWFTIQAINPDMYDNADISSKEDLDCEIEELKLHVLLVEDLKVNRLVATLMLKSMGCTIEVAENGLEALRKITSQNYDIILMDIQMPVMDGVTAVRELRALKINLPVIIGLSAEAMEGDAEKYIAQGMDDYLTKPLKSKDLARKLCYWKGRNKSGFN